MAGISEMSSQKYSRQRNSSECLNIDSKERRPYSRLQCNGTRDVTDTTDTEQIDNYRKHQFTTESSKKDEQGAFENILKCDDLNLEVRKVDKNRGIYDDEPRIYVDSNQTQTRNKPSKLNIAEDTAAKKYKESKEEERRDDSSIQEPKIFIYPESETSYNIEDQLAIGIEKPNNRDNEEPKVFIDSQNLECLFQRESPDAKVNKDVRTTNNRRLSRCNAVDEIAPEIYIDISQSRSDLLTNKNVGSLQTREQSIHATSTYLSDTIFFDPFENRRIDQPRKKFSDSRPTIQTGLYTPHSPNDDGFSLSPIPLSLYPEPPPAYTEIAGKQIWAVSDQPRSNNPTNSRSTNATASPGSQKLVVCQHCGDRVHTNAIRECGAATHVIALSFLLFCLIPITLLVYCTRHFKYINHYCPGCNKQVGYEIPILCQKLVIVKPERQTRM